MFSIAEYQMRMNKTKQKMQERRIEVLLISNPSNMCYLTGYNAWSFYVPQLLVIMIDEDEPIWIGREMDANSAKMTTWLDEQNILSYTDDYVQSEFKHPMDFVGDFLTENGKHTQTIGVEMETHFFSARHYERLERALPDATFVDASELINWIRLIKSDTEITYMKRAATIVQRAMQAGFDAIDEGIRENDVAAAIYYEQIRGTAEFGGDYPAIVPMLPAGERTAAPHITWTNERYKKGPVILEIAGCYRRYHAPLARTMVIGKPRPELIDLANVVVEGLQKTIEAIRPGLTSEQIDEAWRKAIAKSGYKKESRLGYSIGLSFPPDWGEHTISIRPGDKTVIQPNMCFHIIPAIWFDRYGVEISESVHVTENGCETLADFPQELFIKE